ncbi:uncharacterized protein C1orf21 homolog isoform X1 [Anguilla rostrata]|uniref:uncharacterized protein C1orf21 homolog isoform X1 n=1 Tax=Anguilla anguilla TaxID=7936 RepID=UPI0015A7E9D7|nr:uncharacterized protein C1orf21 homolog isoform X1 [Anguilla anguilla]
MHSSEWSLVGLRVWAEATTVLSRSLQRELPPVCPREAHRTAREPRRTGDTGLAQLNEYKMKGVEEVKYMRGGEDDRVNARNQENLEKSAGAFRNRQHKEIPGGNTNRTNIHTSESQQEFFRMLDEKIEKGRDYCSEEEDVT